MNTANERGTWVDVVRDSKGECPECDAEFHSCCSCGFKVCVDCAGHWTMNDAGEREAVCCYKCELGAPC